MIAELKSEEITQLLNEKATREEIISFVVNEAQIVLFEIGTNTPEVWQICVCGSYINPDPKGRWPRIIVPQSPGVFAPQIYMNKRGSFVYGPSDFDVSILTDNSYGLLEDFLNPIEKRTDVKKLVEIFKKITGVRLSLSTVAGLYELGKENARKYVFGNENFRVFYER